LPMKTFVVLLGAYSLRLHSCAFLCTGPPACDHRRAGIGKTATAPALSRQLWAGRAIPPPLGFTGRSESRSCHPQQPAATVRHPFGMAMWQGARLSLRARAPGTVGRPSAPLSPALGRCGARRKRRGCRRCCCHRRRRGQSVRAPLTTAQPHPAPQAPPRVCALRNRSARAQARARPAPAAAFQQPPPGGFHARGAHCADYQRRRRGRRQRSRPVRVPKRQPAKVDREPLCPRG
jgi:hypothetical protein